MRTISYRDILRIPAGLTGETLETLSVQEQGTIRDFVSMALADAWEMVPWPDVVVIEERTIPGGVLSHVAVGYTEIGEILGVYNANPRVTRMVKEYDFITGNEETFLPQGPASAFIEFRKRCPRLFGEPYSAATSYVATTDQMYFTDGNFHGCIVGTVPGDTPVTQPASWAVVQIPWIFREFLAFEAVSHYIGGTDGQTEKMGVYHQKAVDALSREANKLYRQGRQVPRTRVLTR